MSVCGNYSTADLKTLFESCGQRPEQEIIEKVWVALSQDPNLEAKCPIEHLSTFQSYAGERARNISYAVGTLNKLCDKKRELSGLQQETRLAFESFVKPFLVLGPQQAYALSGTQNKKLISRIALYAADKNTQQPPSINAVLRATQLLREKNGEMGLLECLELDFLEWHTFHSSAWDVGLWEKSLRERADYLRRGVFFLDKPTFDRVAQEAIANILVVAKERVKPGEIKGAKVAGVWEKNQASLACELFQRRLKDWEKKRQLSHAAYDYTQYDAMRSKVESAFSAIAGFCSEAELERHPGIQNGAKAKIAKYLKA